MDIGVKCFVKQGCKKGQKHTGTKHDCWMLLAFQVELLPRDATGNMLGLTSFTSRSTMAWSLGRGMWQSHPVRSTIRRPKLRTESTCCSCAADVLRMCSHSVSPRFCIIIFHNLSCHLPAIYTLLLLASDFRAFWAGFGLGDALEQ